MRARTWMHETVVLFGQTLTKLAAKRAWIQL